MSSYPDPSRPVLAPVVAFCRRHDLPLDAHGLSRLRDYLDLLQHFNDSMNLIGPLDEASIVRELIVDSLTPAALYPPSGTILDVGTGAGLPGIPLKLLYPDRPLVLVEPRRKRTTFLKIARNRLDLDEVRLERTRIEDLPDERCDYVVSKAFRSPTEWLEIAERRLTDDGVVVCMTSRGASDGVEAHAHELELSIVANVDDTTELGATPVEPPRRLCIFKHSPH